MSEEEHQPEESFLSHLIELRDRLIRALLAVGIVFVCLFRSAAHHHRQRKRIGCKGSRTLEHGQSQ